MQRTLSKATDRQGLHNITKDVQNLIKDYDVKTGLCHIFITHTSASLTIQENADESARIDLENWLNRLVPENDSLYTHTLEGPDDMPAHIKAILTQTHLTIPVKNNQLALGTWQGVYLWEHRKSPQIRKLIVTLQSV